MTVEPATVGLETPLAEVARTMLAFGGAPPAGGGGR
jgi:hypothetical protein